ncbi:FAD/FMN-containing dehydrogenase/Fe-S oxidoreductase [Skermanella aerolata]|uniref:D-2-hydroxyglutarate dehydrogenase YdiJ n=1 Tax=Skermanella aerolata TaxID=393310 RepID=UPI003D24A69D
MIPRLTDTPMPAPLYGEFLTELRARGFEGDLSPAYADRTVLATDNSIYQVTPRAVAFPRTSVDLVRIARLLEDPRFDGVTIAPRGGGTGTNGQSLTDGLVVDVSRHMNGILEINVEERWVRVQPGVVKDQLNAALAIHGLFFPPELSTSNRATIGGMISTDASGQGSCLYGKTRDHVLELTTVLLDGTLWRSSPLEAGELAGIQRRTDRVGAIHRLVDGIHSDNAELIAQRFPKLNRCLTGYDLAHIRDRRGRFDLNSILCGAEGTLGLIAEAKLNVLPIPKHSALVNVRYASFDAALRDARVLVGFDPASIETIDSRVLSLARDDIIWDDVRDFFPDDEGRQAHGINLVEFVGDTEQAVEAAVRRITDALRTDRSGGRRGFTVARGETDVGRIWEMRKKAVGLLGNMQGDKRPIPFVEDTAVPPENLADYIAEFRSALDRRGLVYGMFGHVDAGVLHVRPAIDMKDPEQEALIRELTTEVLALTRRYKGLLWGEHGKGVRSEFSPEVFGPLYPMLQAIKTAFDPRNQLNPGKIATPGEGRLLTIDGVPTRGQRDRTIPRDARAGFDEALHCNGNGACYNFDPDDAMCPSWKATRERRHSPKGRASLIREWLRQLAAKGVDPVEESQRLRRTPAWRTLPARLRNGIARSRGEGDFSHAVKEAMDGCLACKSCVGQCPIKVDVPGFRAKFLELYYGRYPRPLRDYSVASLERLVPLLARMPCLYNGLVGSNPGRAALRTIGLAESPALSGVSLRRALRERDIAVATPAALRSLSVEERAGSVVLVQDAFTSYFETPLVLDLIDLIRALGFRPWLAPYRPNGKPLHVHGFLKAFERVASANAAMLRDLADTGVDLIGLDPSMTLTYRAEYAGALNGIPLPRVLLVQEWLGEHLDAITAAGDDTNYLLLPHCTERTTAAPTLRDWQTIFASVGLKLTVLPSGCCGMAGTYGHEAEHRATSERIYALSWADHVARAGKTGRLLATGYSCRSQVALIDGVALRHPLQALLSHLRVGVASETVPERREIERPG